VQGRLSQVPLQVRQLRLQTTERSCLTADRTRLKNRIHAILNQWLIQAPAEFVQSRGLDWLRALTIDARGRRALDRLLGQLDLVERDLAESSAALAPLAYSDPRVRLLMALPGVGFVVAQYRGSYETSVMRRFAQFANSNHVDEDIEKLFTLIALNSAPRNGDAHLKNFGIVCDEVQGEARLAPVYDVVTTSIYIAKDSLALTLNGSTRWPTARQLRTLGETRAGRTPAKVRQILECIDHAIQETTKEVRSYIKVGYPFAKQA
jgi:hypothetical protein